MKIQFKKLAVIQQGELSLNDLTLLCGPNNTGKTYIMYSLYGLLDEKFEANFNFVEDMIAELIKNKVCHFNLQHLIEKHFETILQQIAQGFQERLPTLFGVTVENFAATKVKLEFNQDDALKKALRHRWQTRLTLGEKESDWFLDIEKPADTVDVTLTLQDKGIPKRILVELISASIARLIFSQVARRCFLLPSERAGLNLFFKELSSIRNRLLHHAQKDNIDPMEVLKDIVKSRYAEPISDYIQFLNDMTTLRKQKKEDYRVRAQEIQKGILGGKYDVDRQGDVYFFPYRSNTKKMPLHFTSSTVKTLFGLVFYLEHLARPGDCLMIDEPELNLHPNNQRYLARVLAQLVKTGLKIVISTHSSHFVRELNNLIMLNQLKQDHPIRKDYRYQEDEFLEAKQVSAYLFDNKKIIPMEVNEDEGIIATTFDKVIDNLNRSSNEIYWAIQDEVTDE